MLNKNKRNLIYICTGLSLLTFAGIVTAAVLLGQPPNYSYSCEITKISQNQVNVSCEDENINKQVKICGVSIPENYKLEAEKLISSLTSNQKVAVNFVGIFGNSAEIFVSDGNQSERAIAEELLLNGLADVESDNCPNSISMKNALEIAKQNKVGIWK